MTDKHTPLQRHRNMAAIHISGTKPEMVVRKYLFSRGYRYKNNHPRLLGLLDLMLRKYWVVIFVNYYFWHEHEYNKFFYTFRATL